jgi:hypothetical protein
MPFSSIWLFALAMPLLQASERPGIKMTIQSGSGGKSTERTTYTQSPGANGIPECLRRKTWNGTDVRPAAGPECEDAILDNPSS